jgi:Bacterial membrane protein YfhO
VLRWWVARPALAAAVFYALLSLLMVGQGLLPGRTLSSSDGLWSMTPWQALRPDGVPPLGTNFEMADAVSVFQPFFDFARDSLPDVPLWNPHLMGGRPFLANAQSAIFSPFTWPALVLPFWKSLAVVAALKLFVGAFGAWFLGRELGMRFGGALVAGTVFAFGTFFVVWLAWPLTNIFALIPWLLLLTERVVRRPEPLPVAGLAALVGLQFFGGHPETSFHTMFAVGCFFAFRWLLLWRRGGREREALVRPLVAFAVAVAAGTALAALLLVPLVEFLVASGDYERRVNSPPSFASSRFLGALLLHDYWGRPTQTTIEPFVSNRGYYAGAITLMLAAAALILRPTATRIAVAAFGAFALVMTLGAGPLARAVVELPGFRTAHNGRMVIFLLLALALLAGWGLDDVTGRPADSRVRRRLAFGAAVGIFLVPVAWMLVAGTIELGKLSEALEVAWGFSDPPAVSSPAEASGVAPIVRLSALLQWLLLAGLGLALLAAGLGVLGGARWRLPAVAFVALAAILVAADLLRANMGFNPAIPIDHARQPETGAIRYLQSRTPNRFAGVGDPAAIQPLGPDLAMRYGLYDARGYDYPVERRFDRLWRAVVGPPGDVIPPTTVAQPRAEALPALSLLSVADLMQDPGDEPLRLPGLRLAYAASDARIYRNTRALPRAFLVARQRNVADEDAALAAVARGQVDARRVAVTEQRLPGIPTQDGSAPPPTGSATLTVYERQRVVARTAAARRSLLVLTDVHYPGWKASVDGRDTEVERVDYLLRGVVVPPGRHTVEFRYEPVSWRAGWLVSLAGALTIAAMAAVGMRRRRTPQTDGRPQC